MATALAPYWPASALAELGAGYGSTVINLARRSPFNDARIFAAELTDSRARLISLLRTLRPDNFSDHQPSTATRRPDLHVYAAQYVPVLHPGFVDAIASLQPAAVVHVEPCSSIAREKPYWG